MSNSPKYPCISKSFSRYIKDVYLINKNQYFFDADTCMRKPEIKKLFEDFFETKVISINTHRLPRKKKKSGFSITSMKRVIITTTSKINLSLLID